MSNFNAIPQSLRDIGLFCCWVLETKNGRKTKVPYDPLTGQRAQTNNPNTFTDFTTALNEASHYSGLGFLITNDLFVIDCDNCKNPDGSLTQPSAEIVSVFKGCYMEWSPSGKGLHIIGKADGFSFDKNTYWMNNRKLGIEAYISGGTNRFMTLTGSVFHEGDILEKSTELQLFLDKYMRRNTSISVPIPAPGQSTLTDGEVTAKATDARNGGLFRQLWSGDTTGYASASEADFALGAILAFWCGRDIDQMDRLFRQSGLYREKWNRKQGGSTYGRITLEKAAAETKNVYHFSKKAASTSKKPLGYGGISLWNLRPEDNPRYLWADIGSGRLFADYYKAIARYVRVRKMWYVFNGQVWEPDIGALSIMKLAKHLADDIISYATQIPDERKREAYLNYCKKWQKLVFRETVIKEAQSEYPIKLEEFDAGLYAYNCSFQARHKNIYFVAIEIGLGFW